MLVGGAVAIVIITVIPGHEPAPAAASIPDATDGSHLRIIAVAALREGNHLIRIGVGEVVVVSLELSGCRTIAVATDDVHVSITRIPVFIICLRGPYPDQVVQTLRLHHIVVHPLPQLLIDIGTLGTPPEPGCTTCILLHIARTLMERTPYNRNTSILHLRQIAAYLIQLLLGQCILRCTIN